MNISSKRFNVQSIGGGAVSVRDRDAPYHCHVVRASDLPCVNRAALMNEAQFNQAVASAIYGKGGLNA
jgi:hypothetical protein